MNSVLLVQNTRIEGSGHLGDLLKKDDFKINSIHAKYEKIPDRDYDFVVILGAPESANDGLPYLHAEQDLIRKCVSKDTPLLGICLGSQLIAKTFGGCVYRGPKTEIGFYNDLEVDNNSKLFSSFESPFTVFHWHADTYDLPKNAVRLAYSKIYQNQAFCIGSAVGLQFHLEVNRLMVNLWLDNTEEDLKNIPEIDPKKIRNQINEKISIVEKNMEIFYNNFKQQFQL